MSAERADVDGAAGGRTGHPLRWLGPGLILVGAVLALVGSGRTWAQVAGLGFTGQQTTDGLLPTLGWTPLVLVGLMLVVGVRGKRLVAVLGVLLAAGQLATALARRVPPARLLGGTETAVQATSGYLWLVGAAVLVGAGSVVLWLTARWWPDRRARYQRRRAAGGPPDLWKSMDAGLDPTASDEPEADDLSPGDQATDVRSSRRTSSGAVADRPVDADGPSDGRPDGRARVAARDPSGPEALG